MRFKKPESNIPEVDMTPMIDIVFQLIAFFMVITNFENAKADERVKLPVDQLARPNEVAQKKQVLVNLGFDRDKKGEKTSGPLVFWQTGDKLEVSQLRNVMNREAVYYKETNTDLKEVLIVIRADGEFPTGLVQEVMKVSKEVGFEKFSMRIQQKSP